MYVCTLIADTPSLPSSYTCYDMKLNSLKISPSSGLQDTPLSWQLYHNAGNETIVQQMSFMINAL